MGVVIVTEAGRGSGAEIARGLAAKGHTVYAGLRRGKGPHTLEGAEGDVRVAGDPSRSRMRRGIRSRASRP